LPRQGSGRKELIERVTRETLPVVLFEAPHRMQETLVELAGRSPERPAALCRELTKLHEEVLRGTLAELSREEREWLGEIVLVLGETQALPPAGSSDAELRERARALLGGGAKVRAVADHLAEISGRSKREVYALVQDEKDRAE
jgi:16S rRNA (cytidine1402-2'-O)-methyltransferase